MEVVSWIKLLGMVSRNTNGIRGVGLDEFVGHDRGDANAVEPVPLWFLQGVVVPPDGFAQPLVANAGRFRSRRIY